MKIVSVNISSKDDTSEYPVSEITLDDNGIIGDSHAGSGHRQVSILTQESIDKFSKDVGQKYSPGEFYENIVIEGLNFAEVAHFDRLHIGSAELEVTRIGKKCHSENCTIAKQFGYCVIAEEGFFCKVKKGGIIKPGDEVILQTHPLKFKIITVSDRAFSGEYDDKSGPRVKQLLEGFFADSHWHIEIENILIPDDEERLEQELKNSKKNRTDVVITTGGTGIGPRDITPDVVESLCDKTIPGIMEYIRIKYGAENPNALLSRSIAGIMGKTLVYTLPGSVKAVSEYIPEILKTLEHLIFTIHGIDTH